jgi:hypothetical protein
MLFYVFITIDASQAVTGCKHLAVLESFADYQTLEV